MDTERLYRLPDGNWLMLSDVRSARVTMVYQDRHWANIATARGDYPVAFPTNDEASAFVEMIAAAVNAIRSPPVQQPEPVPADGDAP